MRLFKDIQEVRNILKSAMPLNDFISMVDGVKLERVNDRLYKKRCNLDSHPVDNDGSKDSTASFTVCPDKELWYCFGCGSRGDRFEYISVTQNMDHIQAINRVAELCNIDLSPYYAEQTEEEIFKDSLFKENDQARELAHRYLMMNTEAMQYLQGRGISIESIQEFKLGYAHPISGDKVSQFDTIPNSVALQLTRKDQFNHAILFPVCDVMGRMRYFQSRPFSPTTGLKYIGASETHPLYSEDDRLYGFHIAKRKLRNTSGRMIGVEGAPDTIVCNQHGIPAVGFLGTTVNEKTFALLDKYRVSELILLLDGDKAGRDRTKKISEKYMTIDTAVRLKVAHIPDGDPDEFINKYGPEELWKIIDNAPLAVQYLMDEKWKEICNGTITPTKQIEYISSVQQYIVGTTDPLIRNILIEYVATLIGMDPVQVTDFYLKAASQKSGAVLYSIEGEEVLLGYAIRNPEYIVELSMRFKDNDWYLAKHRHLFKILKKLQHVDTDTIFMTAKNMNVGHIITEDWLQSISERWANLEFHMQDVEDKLMRRKAKEILDKASVDIYDMSHRSDEIIDRFATQSYTIISKHFDSKVSNAAVQVDTVMNQVHERMRNPNQILGLSLGPNYSKTTQALLGLQGGDLTIVAANQSVGKTTICENWAMYQAVWENVGIGWFTLEMDKNRMTYRNLSILSGIPCTKIMTGNLTMDEKRILDEWALRLRASPFYISEIGHDVTESMSIARRMIANNNIKAIYVDYLQLQYITDRRAETRSRELGIISKSWKQFAKEYDIPVIGISQLGKGALDAAIARAEHGYGSYEVAQDADNYITLKRYDEEEINARGIEKGNILMNIDKNRMGERSILIDIYHDGPTYRMSEC